MMMPLPLLVTGATFSCPDSRSQSGSAGLILFHRSSPLQLPQMRLFFLRQLCSCSPTRPKELFPLVAFCFLTWTSSLTSVLCRFHRSLMKFLRPPISIWMISSAQLALYLQFHYFAFLPSDFKALMRKSKLAVTVVSGS